MRRLRVDNCVLALRMLLPLLQRLTVATKNNAAPNMRLLDML